ncbi:hypothetical protein DERF_012242 [Dermatophagoides farinae]|uniref:Uncharacterized protein n=1 Tax=Dermatophagoides farinae TaxID=6954 RepID=A0A922L1I8_DERFA|nr:hypothetical protein DERF_012242 [Dermatophagoides farinae]
MYTLENNLMVMMMMMMIKCQICQHRDIFDDVNKTKKKQFDAASWQTFDMNTSTTLWSKTFWNLRYFKVEKEKPFVAYNVCINHQIYIELKERE